DRGKTDALGHVASRGRGQRAARRERGHGEIGATVPVVGGLRAAGRSKPERRELEPVAAERLEPIRPDGGTLRARRAVDGEPDAELRARIERAERPRIEILR